MAKKSQVMKNLRWNIVQADGAELIQVVGKAQSQT